MTDMMKIKKLVSPLSIKRRLLTGVTLLCFNCVAFAATLTTNIEVERPNILVILTDDMGYGDVGFNGAKDIITPNLDQLAAAGTTFDSAYNAHPFCGPSRAGLMTGRYPHKFGSQFNLPTSNRSGGLGIPENETYISQVLQKAGYYTGAIGKWHLGEEPEYHPNNRGFDQFYGFLNGGHDYFPENFKSAYERQRERGMNHTIFHYLRPLERNGVEVEETEYVTDGLTREARGFIKDAAKNKQQPFFLYLAYNAPHSPMQATTDDMAVFNHIKNNKRRTYAAMVYAVDRGVKEIVSTLKETGQLDNTLIVFFSDNGGRTDYGASNAPLKGVKGSVQEGGYRTPMFFHWPQGIDAGKEYIHPISTLDLYPTFASLAHAEIDKEKKLDGKNIYSFLAKNESARPGEMIYALRHRKGLSHASARKDNWKAINFGKVWKLYDIAKDPSEEKDLAQQYPIILREMIAEMEIWSWTNTQPKWFHIQKEGVQWREDAMPRFHETFALPKLN